MTKANDIFASLTKWRSLPDLAADTGWKPHTIRAVISTQARKDGVTVERRRVEGVTSYRIKPDYDPDDDIRQSVVVGLQAVKERKAAGGNGWPDE